MISIATYDTGGEGDYFAMLTANVSPKEILLTDAKAWLTSDFPENSDFYGQVERKIADYNQRFKFNYNICEKNNIGTTVINSLRFRYGLKMIAVTTSNNIRSESVLREGNSYNKNDAVAWTLRLQKMGVIRFPKVMTIGLKMMQQQLDNFGAKRSSDGKVKYEALSGHDDFVTCLNILVNFAKRRILNIPELKSRIPYDGISLDLEMEKSSQEQKIDDIKRMMERRGVGLFDKIDIQFSK